MQNTLVAVLQGWRDFLSSKRTLVVRELCLKGRIVMLRQIVFKTPIPKSHFLSCVFARGMASENFVLLTILAVHIDIMVIFWF